LVTPVPTASKTTAGDLVIGAVAVTALAGLAAWKLEGAVLNRSILRNRAKISKRKANLWN
jgi:hypothetical protein